MLRIRGEKMSKSLKNLILVSDLLQRYSADTIRAYLLGHHYRSEPEWDETELESWRSRVEQLRRAAAAGSGSGEALDYRPYERRLQAALDDDMDTPKALQALLDLSAAILDHAGSGNNPGLSPEALRSLATSILGLRLQ
jgi:cysteinyl-tRNA synthetase